MCGEELLQEDDAKKDNTSSAYSTLNKYFCKSDIYY